MEIKETDIVLCTVRKIEGTTVFVTIDNYEKEGSIVFSEIAAGRIRNIREYVSPNKKIVCKVIKMYQDHVELSFRRVTATERDAVMEKSKQETTFKTMLKQVVSAPEKYITEIQKDLSIQEFLSQAKENPKIISNYFSKTEAEKLTKMLLEKKEKDKEAKRTFTLKSDSNSGINDIKSILSTKDAEVSYLGSSQFAITTKAKDFKEANAKLNLILDKISKAAKDKKCLFEIKEK
jgi:translation initiation factor 2 alpha subunit (eIF-2alpha)